jgi:DNA polymerase
MTPNEELQELMAQAAEHLRYFRELGITHLEKADLPAIAHLSQPAETVSPAREKPVSSLPDKPANASAMPRPEPVVDTVMPRQASSDKSLFGTDAPAESPYARETLEDIRLDLGDCQRCKLWSTRTNLVFGEGNPKAELMFVGEGPGADEDASGRPFVGRAGQLLTKMIEAIQLKREDVYIANVVKSRPPENRAPEKDETEACSPFLYRQIAAIRPKLIVTLGNPSTQTLLNTKEGITRLRGHFQAYPRLKGIKVLPTFHPAFLLRSPDKKREAWEDLKKVRAYLNGEIDE